MSRGPLAALLASGLFLCGCSVNPVAALGIAGASLNAYCAASGAGCSPAVLAYGTLITTEALRDATVFESGAAMLAQLQQIVANLQQDIHQGQALPGLTSGQQSEVAAIVAAANSAIAATEILISKTPVPPGSTTGAIVSPHSIPVKMPPLSDRDKTDLKRMRAKIAAAQ